MEPAGKHLNKNDGSEAVSGPDSSDDVQLVKRVIAGDKAAIQKFLTDYLPFIRGAVATILRRYYNNNHDNVSLEDFVYDICESMLKDEFRTLQRWDSARVPLKRYLHVYCRVRTLDKLRGMKRKPQGDLLINALTVVESNQKNLESEVRLKHLYEKLIASLTPQDWELFELTYKEERPTEEICQLLGLSENAYYQRRMRLKNRIAQLLADDLKQ